MVVLTYTCINWLRTLGCLRARAAGYQVQGFIVVGVATPESPFQRDVGTFARPRKGFQSRISDRPTPRLENLCLHNQYWLGLELIYGEHVGPRRTRTAGPRELGRSRDPRAPAVLLESGSN